MEVFEARQKLLGELGWAENPFVKDLRVGEKQVFLKYYCPFEAGSILERLAFDAKACLLLGPKGVGKTSALYFMLYSLPEEQFLPVILKEPPKNLQELAEQAGFAKQQSFFARLLGFKPEQVSRQELAKRVRAVGKTVVFLVDEAHLSKDMHMEFKYLLDDAANLRMVFSALGREGFPDSLLQLVGDNNVFKRKSFSSREMTQIIEHRVNAVGGAGLNPFTQGFLDSVFTEQNLLSPRYVFDELNSFLAQKALGKDAELEGEKALAVSEEKTVITRDHVDWWYSLSPSQQKIMELLLTKEALLLADIVKETGLSQNTAFNALYQLRGDDKAETNRKPEVPFPLVEARERRVGARKKNVYFLESKVKNLFTLH